MLAYLLFYETMVIVDSSFTLNVLMWQNMQSFVGLQFLKKLSLVCKIFLKLPSVYLNNLQKFENKHAGAFFQGWLHLIGKV